MSNTDTELANAIRTATDEYDRARWHNAAHIMGQDDLQAALEQQEMGNSAFDALPSEARTAYATSLLIESLRDDGKSESEDITQSELLDDANNAFDERAHTVFGKLADTSYWLHTSEPDELRLSSDQDSSNTPAGQRSMLGLVATVGDDDLKINKIKIFGRENQPLKPTETDKAILLAAAARLSLVAEQLNAES
ncbi:hypothetical protein H7097_02425 [Aeromicrobium sp.]|nr:hypothetical protein [Candidatus Saccharibacteria bacterium]